MRHRHGEKGFKSRMSPFSVQLLLLAQQIIPSFIAYEKAAVFNASLDDESARIVYAVKPEFARCIPEAESKPKPKGHIAEAAAHLQEAVELGKQGHAGVLVQGVEKALQHVEMAQKEKAAPTIDEGIKYLKEAVNAGKKGDAAGSVKLADIALLYLEC